MDFIVRLFGGGPKDPLSEMKRLLKLSDKEVVEEIRKAREKLLNKSALELVPKTLGAGERGFLNLGNTCFISATFQCLLHCRELVQGLFRRDWEKAVNPLTSAFQGKLAVEFFQLTVAYWRDVAQTPLDISELHRTLSGVNKELEDFSQHDSQEFLAFFLDALHDDLNKKVVRRYEEVPDWKNQPILEYCQLVREIFSRRNDSFVVDLFYGQFCSQIECPSPECGRKSVSCEPFNMVSLDPPSTTSVVSFQFLFFPPTFDVDPQRITVNCLDNEPMETLLQHIQNLRPDLAGPHVVGCLYRSFDLQSTSPDWPRLTSGTLYYSTSVLILAQVVSPQIMRVVFGRDPNSDFSQESWGILEITPFNQKFREGYERLLWVPRDANRSKIQLAVYMVYRRSFQLAGFFPPELDPTREPASYEDLVHEFGLLSSQMNDLGIKSPFDLRIFNRHLEVTTNEELFGTSPAPSLNVKVHFYFPESKLRGLFQMADPRTVPDLAFDHATITLESCLEKFIRKEELDQENMWYCSGCKGHKRASKKMLISRLPRVLIIHLKRFKRVAPDRPQYRKFGDLITYPLEGLDMSPYCNDPTAPATYDLFAVSSHYGSVSNGHYVAFTKNLRSKEWNCYDDRIVKPVNEAEVANKSAYLLFYSLRSN